MGLRGSLLVTVALACSIAAAASASTSPAALLASIRAAGQAQRSVHYTTASSGPAPFQVHQVGDAGRTAGIQRITFRKGGKTGEVTVIVVGGSAYIRGDAFTLVDYMAFKAAAATMVGGKWIRIPPTDRAFSAIAAAVTLSSNMAQIDPTAPLTATRTVKVAGQRVLGVTGKAPGSTGLTTETVYGRAATPHLPVEVVATEGPVAVTATFSRWNEAIRLAAPKGAVPISATGLE